MIIGAFRSEWIKLRRPSLLVATYVGLAAAASAFTILLFTQATKKSGGDGGLPSLTQLGQPNGLVHGLSRATILLGIVAFGIAAAQIASEYSLGTLRQLLVRQPRRWVLLAGKYLGVVTFLAIALVFAAVIATVVAFAMAHGRHVPTGAWTSSAGISDLTRALGDLLLAVVGYASLGLAVGLFLRSSVFAVIIGFAWLLPIESIVMKIVPSTTPWLPGSALTIVGEGGTSTLSYGHALVVSIAYVLVAAIVTTVAFIRRDVTA
jgi:ABC-2 type transport system permease protein